METYSERHRALCEIIDDLPLSGSSDSNRFRIGEATGSDDIRSFKLDHLLSIARSRKGKEVERFFQVEQLRLSERDLDNLGQIGDGQFGSVSAVRCKLDGKVYAMKSIKKYTAMRSSSQMNLPLERYIHILAIDQANSPASEIAAAFQSETTLHLITTYAPHGSLWDRMCGLGSCDGETSQAGRMAEDEIRWWSAQMIRSIEWLHGQGFVHRDIKPHNFLIHSPTRLSLTDFGSAAALVPLPSSGDMTSRRYINKQQCLMPIGTPDYIAPEVLIMAEDAMLDEFDITTSDLHQDPDKTVRPGDLEDTKGYGLEVDWWSFGATVYEMATGEAPFYARTVRETYDLIIRCGEGTYQPPTSGMTDDLASLCLSLLTSSYQRLGRGSVGDVSNHPFFYRHPQSRDHPPPAVLALPVIELGEKNDQTDTDVTFDHHFQSSVGMTTTLTTSCSSNNTDLLEPQPDRWCGWTYIPAPSAFTPLKHSFTRTSSDRPVRPLPRHLQIPPVTPARSTTSMPTQFPMTTPRSTVRKRPVSDQRAMAQLVKCVQHSAQKRASSVKPRLLGELGKEAWTPTPKARPPLMERTNSIDQVPEAGRISVEGLTKRRARLENGLIGLEQRFAKLKSRLQAS